MPKKILMLFFILCLFMKMAFAQDTDSQKIKIGVIYNITGEQAGLDLFSWQGAQIAEKLINDNGGVLNKQLELVFYDGATDKERVLEKTAKLIMDDKVSVILGFSDSDFALLSGVLTENAKIPFLTSGATDSHLIKKIGKSFFMLAFSDRAQAKAAVAFAVQDLKFKSAYILKDKEMDYTLSLASAFRKEFEKRNGKESVLLEDTFISNQRDFSKQIEKLLNLKEKPDLLYIAAGPQDILNIIQAFRTAGFDTAVIGGDSYDNESFRQNISGYIGKGVFYTTHAYLDDVNTVLNTKEKTFIDAYTKEFFKRPNAFSALGFDAVTLIAEAIKEAGGTSPKEIQMSLEKIENFKGITGTISYPKKIHLPKKPVFIMQIDEKGVKLADIWRIEEQF